MDCFNCDTKLADCECGDTETLSNDGIGCPHCGFLHDCSVPLSTSEHSVQIRCIDCGLGIEVDYNNAKGKQFWLASKPKHA